MRGFLLADKLIEIAERFGGDPEAAHAEADMALMRFVMNRCDTRQERDAVREAWAAVPRWYA